MRTLRQRRAELALERARGARVDELGFLDQRADPIRLLARRAMRRDSLDELGSALLGQDDGLHGLPARRQLADHGAIEIRVGRHRQRPRNRRRRHDELVRHTRVVLALLLEPPPLLDAEAMLLVDDHERELPKLDALLEQRVRADDDGGAAVGDGRRASRRARAPVARRATPRPRCRAARASARSSRNAARRAAPSAP